jgi:hypothetical protein
MCDPHEKAKKINAIPFMKCTNSQDGWLCTIKHADLLVSPLKIQGFEPNYLFDIDLAKNQRMLIYFPTFFKVFLKSKLGEYFNLIVEPQESLRSDENGMISVNTCPSINFDEDSFYQNCFIKDIKPFYDCEVIIATIKLKESLSNAA